jgi:hypothetical protein
MGDVLRRFLVALVTIAFLGGTLERSALGLTPADPCPLTAHTHAVAHQPLHSGHEHHAYPATHRQNDGAKDQGTKCFCYGMAGFNVFPAPPASDIIFQITTISFSATLKTFNGRSVVLDPGIPKRIA